ncbi:putative reverse transcriptase/RNA-dependent DNA polymerase [Citrus sinensis]|uniref:Reverse transcriptase/RNA-dependent DNA polymerase n=1 Tax=Citrus sinensis TaxID=2711 RepID=A0ACB8NLY4_CITSI|nr:putative reverse transcriptase/RNA-dependent DNA polymerase [Citrus sinensis]
MLGKQGWRLLTNPNALVTRLFKARYFPSSSFAEAQLGSNLSFVWRSILAAQPAILRGGRIQIRGGQQTIIGNAPWLPDKDSGFISSSLPTNIASASVDSLMIPNHRRWDYAVIPLGTRHDKDSWFWLPDSKGLYTVRSCYRLLNSMLSPPSSRAWRKLWQLSIPAKVKNFLWRAMSNVLPTADNLLQRRVENLFLCQQARKNAYFPLIPDTPGHGSACWFKPCEGYSRGLISLGAVIRSDQGDFISAKSDILPGSFEAREAEAIGVREALSWLKKFAFHYVILEMDSLQVFNALHDKTSFPNGFGSIIDDCRALARSLGEVAFSFVHRSVNSAAHTVAQVGGSMSGSGEWRFVPPPWLVDALAVL